MARARPTRSGVTATGSAQPVGAGALAAATLDPPRARTAPVVVMWRESRVFISGRRKLDQRDESRQDRGCVGAKGRALDDGDSGFDGLDAIGVDPAGTAGGRQVLVEDEDAFGEQRAVLGGIVHGLL